MQPIWAENYVGQRQQGLNKRSGDRYWHGPADFRAAAFLSAIGGSADFKRIAETATLHQPNSHNSIQALLR
jgi:hypothetical protein